MGKTHIKEKYFLILILVLAVMLRFVNLGQSFWLDEASQAQQSVKSVSFIWSGRSADFHPPLFYLLAHYWLQLGKSEVFLRLLPVFFGVAAVPALYTLAKKLFASEKISLLAALFLAINPYHVYYSQEFRSYSLLTLLGILSMHLLIIESNWLFILNVMLLYTHYSSALLIVAQIIYFLVFRRKRLGWFALQLALTLILFLPWLPQFLSQLQAGVNIDTYLPGWRNLLTSSWIKSLPLIIFKFVAGRINILSKIAYGIYILFVFGATLLGIILAKSRRSFMYVWFFVPIFISILLSFYIPQTQPFRLIYCLPVLMLIFAQAAVKYPKLFITIVVYISIFGNVIYFTRPRLQREQWRQAIAFLANAEGTVVVKFSDKFAPFYWYAPELPVRGAVTSYPAKEVNLDGLSGDVYLLEYLGELTDPAHVVENRLSAMEYTEVKEYNFEGVGIIKHFKTK